MDYTYWTNDEIEYLQQNYGVIKLDDIAIKLNRSRSSVAGKASQLGLYRPGRWTEDELQYLRDNYKNKTYKQLSLELGRSKTAIDLKINRLGLKKDRYEYDHSYFHNIDSQDKAYWLGFFYADGCVHKSETCKSTSYEACIKLQASDDGHLRKFNKCIGGNVDVQYETHKCSFNGVETYSASIRLFSKEIFEDLVSHGCVPAKSFTIRFPELREDLIPHFVRGYFDGDGCFCKDSNSRNVASVNFCSASEQFLQDMRTILYQHSIQSYITDEKGRNTFRLYIRGMENCDKMLSFLYHDAITYLDRKYVKAIQFYEDNQIAQRLLRRSVMSGFYFKRERNGDAEMPTRVEGCDQNRSHTQSVDSEPA